MSDTTTTRYKITTGPAHHSATDRPWMTLPTSTIVECLSVGARCTFLAASADAQALEAALEADDDVLEYYELPSVSAHGEREGRADYLGRAQEVARDAEDPEWAWPYNGADAAYINAVGSEDIRRQVGAASWSDICEEWCEAFRRGYEAAHAEIDQR